MSWLSALLGLDASHNAGKSGQAAIDQQQVANQYGQQASGIYGNLNAQGQQQQAQYGNTFLPLLSQYANLAGLGGGAAQGQQGGNGGRIPPSVQGSQQGNLYPGGSFPGGGGATSQDTSNPYSLDQNQQQQLNQSVSSLSQQKQQALAQTQQALAQQGITGGAALAAAQQVIDEHFADLQAKTQTEFYQKTKEDKLSALQQLIGQVSGYGQQGIQEQQSAANGLLGLQSGAQGAQSALQQQSFQQQNLAQQQQAGLLNLIGFASGGGFGGAGNTPAATSAPKSIYGI